ncbi:MAG: formyl-CoA transferase [Deltaproteobacteria bacterium]|nr:formyl-CoA transferase [Deltaproteobacteria bacterium]HCH62149.1 formyl-CoA transferase [Deltaproteobacteria bacterium]
MRSSPSDASQPLRGVRILDFTRVLAGPYGTMHLADLGADVVKVEHPSGGDDTRSYGPPFQDGISTYFLSINRGKRSVALDLKQPEARATARALALKADVVFENFRPGVMERLGLDAETLRAVKPSLICCTIRAFANANDPRPGYDLMIQGLSGIPSITGPVDGEPYKCGASIADMTSGMHAVQAICAALFHRERTGEGASIVIPLMDSQRSLLTYHASAWLNGGSPSQRRGNHHPSIHPFCVLPTADGHICLCIGNDKLWRAFCVVAGAPALGDDPRFVTNRLRVANRAALDAWLEPTVAARTLDDWLHSLAAAGVPAGPMRSVEEALEDAELVAHPHPVSGTPVRTLPVPILIDGERPTTARAPSLLGADTAAVCAEWLKNRD